MGAINRKSDIVKILLVLSLIISAVVILLEIYIQPSVFQIILNSLTIIPKNKINSLELNYTGEQYSNGNISVNNNNDSDTANKIENLYAQSSLKLSSRNLRELVQHENNTNTNKSNYYYEEQMPVVVYAKSDINDYENVDDGNDDDGDDDNQYYEYDYPFNKELETSQQYENRNDDINTNNGNDNGKDDYYYYSSPVDNTDRNVNNAIKTDDAMPLELGRSFHNNDNYNAYYRQWHYVTTSTTPSPYTSPHREPYKGQLFTMNSSGAVQDKSELPHTFYPDHGYTDYMTTSDGDSSALHSHNYRNKAILKTANEQDFSQEMPLLSVLRTLKTIWDLYQSLVSAWNAMAMPKSTTKMPPNNQFLENRMKIRINSKKAGNLTKSKNVTLKKANGVILNQGPLDKVEPRHFIENADETGESWRRSRQIQDYHEANDNYINNDDNENAYNHNHVTEKSRYIKGDPLKGYYDFVVTEGSYKFWAVFQLGTAILIIYSTFAAIYYSKVNPLTSDYDYADYLGAGRSLSTNNLDFNDDYDDDDNNENKSTTTQQTWYNWLQPISSGTFKFILDAIDKLPVEDDAWTHKMNDDNFNDHFKEIKSYETEIMKK